MDNGNLKGSTLELINREKMSVSGVNNILGFDSEAIVLETSYGRLTVEGQELKIESLTKDSGTVHLYGKISGLYYTDKAMEKGKLFGIFK